MTSPISAYAAAPSAMNWATSDAATNTQQSDPTASGSTTTTAAGSSDLLNPQAFLQLLVAQLKYQDPTSPTDTSTFMNQTAMLSQVQTMNSMSTTLTSLVSAQQTQAATAMIGKQITWVSATGVSSTGTVDSASLLSTGATLQVGSTSVPLANVTNVSDAH